MMPAEDARGRAAPLSPERWARARALVEEALSIPIEARAAFIAAACGGDDALRRRIERLAATCERADEEWRFLARPAGELFAPLVAGVDPLVDPLVDGDAMDDARASTRRHAKAVAVLARLRVALADRYRIERELGAGGMATVYVAHDLRLDRRVAIKVLHAEVTASLGAERFLGEIRTTAGLQHPHILPLLESGSADGLLYYVMPVADGETLRARLGRERQLDVADAVGIASDVADALDYAHRHGVIHRDIKPENILLHEGRPVLADFGIALAVSSDGVGRITQPGLMLGTPQYMSPEQVAGARDITTRSDVYSLGVLTYEMLTGEPPFTGATIPEIVRGVRTAPPRPMGTLRARVPPNVEAAVLTALAKLPADRFARATDFARALADVAYADRRAPGGSRAARPRLVVALLVALAMALGGAVWGWSLD